MTGVLLLFHILGATIWTGGHLVLALSVLPSALRSRTIDRLAQFEAAYERVGIPALLLQVATGLALALRWAPDPASWFDWTHPTGRLIGLKLLLLAATIALALDARLRVIPKLAPERLTDLAWHVIPVTILSVLFVVVGLSVRTGWLF